MTSKRFTLPPLTTSSRERTRSTFTAEDANRSTRRFRRLLHMYLVDDTYYGDVATLRNVAASTLAGVNFYEGYEAQYKFGSGHMGGVIQLITKR